MVVCVCVAVLYWHPVVTWRTADEARGRFIYYNTKSRCCLHSSLLLPHTHSTVFTLHWNHRITFSYFILIWKIKIYREIKLYRWSKIKLYGKKIHEPAGSNLSESSNYITTLQYAWFIHIRTTFSLLWSICFPITWGCGKGKISVWGGENVFLDVSGGVLLEPGSLLSRGGGGGGGSIYWKFKTRPELPIPNTTSWKFSVFVCLFLKYFPFMIYILASRRDRRTFWSSNNLVGLDNFEWGQPWSIYSSVL